MLSKEAWEAVHRSLMSGVEVTLLVNDIKINFKIARLKGEMRLVIIPVMDYATLEKWHGEDCPERHLFFRRVTTSAWTAESRRRMAGMSKSQLKRLGVDPGKKLTRYYPWWTQFDALKKHLSREATTIEVLWPEV